MYVCKENLSVCSALNTPAEMTPPEQQEPSERGRGSSSAGRACTAWLVGFRVVQVASTKDSGKTVSCRLMRSCS